MSYFFPSVIGLPTEGMSGPTGWLSPVTSGGTADTVSVDAWHTALGTGTPEPAWRPSTRKVLVVHSAINRRTCEPADMEWCGYTFASGANHQFDRRQLEIPDCTHGPAGACTTVCEFRVAGQCRRECAPVTVGAPTCPKHVRSMCEAGRRGHAHLQSATCIKHCSALKTLHVLASICANRPTAGVRLSRHGPWL